MALVVGNLVILVDAWASTPEGQATIVRWREKAKGCAGCTRRRAKLKAMVNHVHWDAQRIVEGEDVPTVKEDG